jgi:hypothetical protein
MRRLPHPAQDDRILDEPSQMRRLPHPMQGVAKAPFAFRAHPSVARDLVAWLEALPSRARRPQGQGRIERLINQKGRS